MAIVILSGVKNLSIIEILRYAQDDKVTEEIKSEARIIFKPNFAFYAHRPFIPDKFP